MDKEHLLQAYIGIETKNFKRSDKNKKLTNLIGSIKTNEYSLSLTDILHIVNYLLNTNTTIRYPFFSHVIYPILSKGAENNNIEAIKQLVKLFDRYESFRNIANVKKNGTWSLITKGLQLSPYDKELLTTCESWQKDYLKYTLHELPSGVLYGSNGATIEECDELLQDLANYEEVCKKLNLDRYEMINNCKRYYTSYKSYLTIYKSYNGFADYLAQHGMADRQDLVSP